MQVTFKLLSVDPANYDDAPSEGIRRLLEYVHGKDVRKDQTYDTSIIGQFILPHPSLQCRLADMYKSLSA